VNGRKTRGVSRGVARVIVGVTKAVLNFVFTSTWIFNFTSRPLYPRGKCSWYPLNRRCGGQRIGSDRICTFRRTEISLAHVWFRKELLLWVMEHYVNSELTDLKNVWGYTVIKAAGKSSW